MEVRLLAVVVVLCVVSIVPSHADSGAPGTAPCTGEACQHNAPQDPPVPGSAASRQKETVIVVEEEEVEVRTHRVGCTRSEENEVACLQGMCYALDMGGFRSPFCQCPEMYEGHRCEKLSTYYFLQMYSAELTKAGIIAGVFFLVVLIIVLISVYFSVKKGKAKRRMQAAEKRKNKESTTALKPSREDLSEEQV